MRVYPHLVRQSLASSIARPVTQRNMKPASLSFSISSCFISSSRMVPYGKSMWISHGGSAWITSYFPKTDRSTALRSTFNHWPSIFPGLNIFKSLRGGGMYTLFSSKLANLVSDGNFLMLFSLDYSWGKVLFDSSFLIIILCLLISLGITEKSLLRLVLSYHIFYCLISSSLSFTKLMSNSLGISFLNLSHFVWN